MSAVLERVKETEKTISFTKYESNLEASEIAFSLLLTCEHASNHLPTKSHADWAWGQSELEAGIPEQHWGIDIGAYDFCMELLKSLSDRNAEIANSSKCNGQGCLSAITAEFSRLLLDCNRPIGSDTMFRDKCDGVTVELNKNITEEEKERRIKTLYEPYHNAIAEQVEKKKPKLVFSVHSFNPEYEGEKREMEVGILFDESGEKLGSLITKSMREDGIRAEENEPWSGKKGFIFAVDKATRDTKGSSIPLMIEVRNDLLVHSNAKVKVLESLVKALTSPEVLAYCSTTET